MWWFVYTALIINLFVIWFMRKHLTPKEIYITWPHIAVMNMSADIVFSIYLKLYELDGIGVQLRVHLLEWTLGPSYGIIFLNFMPQKLRSFVLYLIAWLAYSVVFEAITVHLHFVNYSNWKLLYSAIVYLCVFLYLRWHIHYIRRTK